MSFEEKIWEALRRNYMRKSVRVEITDNEIGKTSETIEVEISDSEIYQFDFENSTQTTTIYVYEENMSSRYAGEGITITESPENPFITYSEMFRHYANEVIAFLSEKRSEQL